MNNDSWIKLFRKFREWEWYSNSNVSRVFLELLLTANSVDKKYLGITVKRGQTIIGRKSLSKTLEISEQSIRTTITKLKSTSEITSKQYNKFSVITILNYDKYQQSTSKSTINQPATNQQLTTPKEYKNIRTNTLSCQQTELITFWNETIGSKYKPSTEIETNLQYWLKVFSLEEIKTAIGNIPSLLDTSQFWKTMRPKLFFRQKNKLGEADYIEQALNVKNNKEKYIKL